MRPERSFETAAQWKTNLRVPPSGDGGYGACGYGACVATVRVAAVRVDFASTVWRRWLRCVSRLTAG